MSFSILTCDLQILREERLVLAPMLEGEASKGSSIFSQRSRRGEERRDSNSNNNNRSDTQPRPFTRNDKDSKPVVDRWPIRFVQRSAAMRTINIHSQSMQWHRLQPSCR